MNKQDMFEMFLEQGYSEEEAKEKIVQYEEEEEYLAFIKFKQLQGKEK